MAQKFSNFRIINWHSFSDTGVQPLTTAGFANFITGENASGKTTIADALTTVLFANTSGYNKANDINAGRGGRTLMGYVRCQESLTANNQEEDTGKAHYMRMGHTVSHIAVEITNTKNNAVYVLGATFEVAPMQLDSSKIDRKWWVIKDMYLKDLLLTTDVDGGLRTLPWSEVRGQLPERCFDRSSPALAEYHNEREAKPALSKLLGISAEKFGSKEDMKAWQKTMQRCIAFKPESAEMKNSDAFVRNIVLEAETIDEEQLEALLSQLQEACSALNAIKARGEELQKILEMGERYGDLAKHHYLLENTISLIRVRTQEDRVAALDAEYELLAAEHKSKESAWQSVRSELQTLRDEKKELELDPTIQATTPLSREIEAREKELAAFETAAAEFTKNLEKVKEIAAKVNNVFGANVLDDNRVLRALSGEQLTLAELQSLVSSLDGAQEKLFEYIEQIRKEDLAIRTRMGGVREEIEALKKGRVKPDLGAQRLKDAIQQAFKERRIADEPKFLYELLNYKDDTWARAIEANMGRKVLFSVVVAPEHYKLAARALGDIPEEVDISGTSLINTKAFATDVFATESGSLADNLVTGNPFIRQYINCRYNHVMLVDNAIEQEDVRGTYLDKRGRKYAAYSLTRLRMPTQTMIGEEARRKQLQAAEDELAELEAQSKELQGSNEIAREARAAFRSNDIADLRSSVAKERLQQVLQLPELKKTLIAKKAQYKEMTSSESFFRLHQVELAIKAKQAEEENAAKHERTAAKALADKGAEQTHAQRLLNEAEETYAILEKGEPDAALRAENYLAEQKAKFPKRFLPRHEEELSSEARATKNEMEAINTEIRVAQTEYSRSLNANFPCLGHMSLSAFREAYDRICSDELPVAQHLSERYNKEMSELLQNRLLTKLKTCIANARESLRVLNKTLANMTYNGKYYQFDRIKPAKGKERFYDVIVHFDPADKMLQNFSLLGNSEEDDEPIEDEAEVIRELVNILRRPKSEKGENWLDYRTYCEFAIDVVSADNPDVRCKLDNSVATFSGAEVQIPFYMILTASLVNRYARGARLTAETLRDSDALRIMIVDECFSKMDVGNTQQLVKFICQEMGIQLVAIAPPGTFTALAGVVDNVIYCKQEVQNGKTHRACFSFTADEFLVSNEFAESLTEPTQ